MPFSNLSDFPLAFLIEYGMYRKNKCPYDDVEKISEYYYLLALRDLAKFEAGINDSVPNALSREYLQNELACTKYLLDSLYSAFISERDIGKERSIRARVAFEILEDGLPGIRAHEARDESNARISLAARKKWLPLILDVHKRLQKIPKPTKSDACRFAVKGKAEKWKSLRNAYNTWAKDPEKYEEGLN